MRKNSKLRKIVAMTLALAATIGSLAVAPAQASAQTSTKYPYTVFTSSKQDGIMFDFEHYLTVNGNVCTNETYTSTVQYGNVNGTITQNANEEVMHIHGKLQEKYFANAVKYNEDYTYAEMNMNINNPMYVSGTLSLDGNINLNAAIGAVSDVKITGETLNSNNAVIYSRLGDITIDGSQTSVNGLIYAPFGTVNIKCMNFNMNGIIIANDVIIEGNGANINYSHSVAEFIGTESEEFVWTQEDIKYLPDTDADKLPDVMENDYGTDVTLADSDGDGLTDGEEVFDHKSDPTLADTDNDGLDDGDEIYFSTNPNEKDSDGNGVSDGDEKREQTATSKDNDTESAVTEVTVAMSGTGNLNKTTTIERLKGQEDFAVSVNGLIGEPFSIETSSKFDTATITFKVDKSKLGDTVFEDLLFLWYDEENNKFVELDTYIDVENSTVSTVTTHFSKYLVVDSDVWYDVLGVMLTENHISNEADRDYVNMAIKYYLCQPESVSALEAEQSVVLLFEGASNKATTIEAFRNSDKGAKAFFASRSSAICIVIKKGEHGKLDIVYFNDNCSTLPDRPKAEDNSKYIATTLDGIYRLITCNHDGRYAALNAQSYWTLDKSSGYQSYVRCVRLTEDGFINGNEAVINTKSDLGSAYNKGYLANGINVHTRGNNIRTNGGTGYSEGCILIDSYKSNNKVVVSNRIPEYVKFLNAVYPKAINETDGTSKSVIDNLDGRLSNDSSKEGYNVRLPKATSTEQVVGTLIIDRYLYQEEMDEIYGNAEAVDAIVVQSVAAEKEMRSMFEGLPNVTIKMTDVPEKIKEGDSFNLAGAIYSDALIVEVTAAFISGITQVEEKVVVNAETAYFVVENSSINEQLKFSNLLPGKYTLWITATNEDGASNTYTKEFEVEGDTVVETRPHVTFDVIAIPDMAQGKDYNVTGTITSNNIITEVIVYLLTGTEQEQKIVLNPRSKRFVIEDSVINEQLRFENLKTGKHTFWITATNADGVSNTYTDTFELSGTPAPIPYLTINVTSAPEKITQGDSFNLQGTITSNDPITEVSAFFLSEISLVENKVVINPISMSVDIGSSDINKQLKFGNLLPGKYTLWIMAKNGEGGSNTYTKEFEVIANPTPSVPPYVTFKMDGIPDEIKAGRSVNIRGTIESNELITDVVAYFLSGISQVQKVSFNPRTTSLDVASSAINQQLRFGSLSAGTYTLWITATTSGGASNTYTETFVIK